MTVHLHGKTPSKLHEDWLGLLDEEGFIEKKCFTNLSVNFTEKSVQIEKKVYYLYCPNTLA